MKEKRKAARESKKLQKGRQCKKQISEALSESEDSNDKFQFADSDDSYEKDLEIERNQKLNQNRTFPFLPNFNNFLQLKTYSNLKS